MRAILSLLLHLANSRPPMLGRDEFYALKERLLEKYGRFDGFDVQEIEKECWGPWLGHCGPQCPKCGGSGIFERFWVTLHRYRFGRYSFHVPRVRHYAPPETLAVTIRGYIRHRDYGRLPGEAALWLYLACGEWSLLWRDLRGHCHCGFYLWPFLNLQRVTMELRLYLSKRRCFCGKVFRAWGRGWQMCGPCRERSLRGVSHPLDDSGVPF